ncbi:hypothetical protein SHKM778_87160 [Streptomyces sp. KM77-8]|uniref:Uncharacterized protein n=1 Tax=Streptomyces haneummycinicus TaxID=3074435 RepID=A0AAT9HY58_9ACTN
MGGGGARRSPDVPLPRVLEDAARHTLTPGLGVSAASWNWVRTLLRLAQANPALCRVWAETCQASERHLAEVLAERLTADHVPCDGGDNVAFRTRLAFAAAVASAAVRTAMENWAAGRGPPRGREVRSS